VSHDYVQALRHSVPSDVLDLCRRLRESGHRAWVVGGCVRDHVLDVLRDRGAGAESVRNDWDVATDAHPDQVTQLFRRVIPTGIKHGTVTVLLGDVGYEVTTLRGGTTYSDGRRPDSVYFVDDIVADLARRDFTINAMAYDPLEDQLIDPFDGIDDLERGVLRAVGDPAARFAEDGLRVLRAARFVATLEVEIEHETARAIEPSLASYAKVSPERIREEWVKSMKARAPSRAFSVMKDHGMLAISAPEMLESVDCEQNRFHAFDVWGHAMACLDACPENAVLRMAGLLHDIGKPRSRAFSDKTRDYTFYDHERIGAEMVEPLLARLRFSNDERARIVGLVRHHLICYDESWSDAAVRRWIKRVSPELLDDLYALNRADVLGKGRDASDDLERLGQLQARVKVLMAQGTAMSVRDLDVDGNVLMKELGRSPGRWLGDVLAALLDEVIERPELNQREALLARAREIVEGDAS
jgi:tRNA nucleotidyltransferase (CCA-adding enzyme)